MTWNSKVMRRAVFLRLAKMRSFDPLLASNWYQLSWDDFSAFYVCLLFSFPLFPLRVLFLVVFNYITNILFVYQLARSMITQCYKKSYVAALIDLFPELRLEQSNFLYAHGILLFFQLLFYHHPSFILLSYTQIKSN